MIAKIEEVKELEDTSIPAFGSAQLSSYLFNLYMYNSLFILLIRFVLFLIKQNKQLMNYNKHDCDNNQQTLI